MKNFSVNEMLETLKKLNDGKFIVNMEIPDVPLIIGNIPEKFLALPEDHYSVPKGRGFIITNMPQGGDDCDLFEYEYDQNLR